MHFFRLILFFIIGLLCPIFIHADGNIAGVVTDALTGAPLSGVTIRVIKGSDDIRATAMTNPDGSYSTIDINNGYYTVEASLSGFQTSTVGARVKNNQTTTANFALLPEPGILFGVVTDTSMPPMPISNASVEVFQNDVAIGFATTDSGGNYTISGLPPGSSTVKADALNFQFAEQQVTVAGGETVEVPPFALLPDPGKVTGTVKDNSMTPIAGATVELILNNLPLYTTTTDMAGNYAFSGLAPGDYIVEAEAENFALKTKEAQVIAGMETIVDFVLDTAFGFLGGTVTAASSGAPIAGATVEVIFEGTVIQFEETDASGNYFFEGLPPGSYFVKAQKTNFQTATSGAIVKIGMTTTVNFALQSSFGTLSGHVASASTGMPLAGAFIEVEFEDQVEFSTLTDALGNYKILGIAPGLYVINAHATNFQTGTQPASIEVDKTTIVDFSLQPNPATLHGQVTDANTHLPISEAFIQLKLNNIVTNHTLSDSNGNYTIRGIAEGSYSAICHAAQYEIAFQSVSFAAGQIQTLDFALISGSGDVSGTILNAQTGLPISDALVEVILNNVVIESTVTDPSGNYDLPDLPPGSYIIQVSATGFYGASQSFVLNTSEVRTINLSLIPDSPPRNLTGQVINNRFLLQTDRIHHIQWEASLDSTVIEYRVYRNGMLLAIIPSSAPLLYDDHNRSRSITDVYRVDDRNAVGDVSSFVTISLR